ncbi:hypothetical protein V6N13_145007 [Hibiscus sabdariffa]|uniref:DNA-3-methyladenine glycosylase I n=1 Tax=Hibiscus sabdariffa TaxID=183260 RepID=A0ABR2FM71_9ROSI
MSGAPRLRSMNVADSEARPVFGPAGNKAGSLSARKPVSKPVKKVEKSPVETAVVQEKKASSTVNSLSPKTHSVTAPSLLRRHERLLHSNLSLHASCSSDASTDSFHSQASTGRLIHSNSVGSKRKPYTPKPRSVASDGGLDLPSSGLHQKKRCAWVTPNTDPIYAAFHDEEWGVPVHDDKKLFELLVLSGALSELTWSAILSKRHIFREVFMDFDPLAVSKLNEKKLIAHGSLASSLLSELKLRAIIENARQISKVDYLTLPFTIVLPVVLSEPLLVYILRDIAHFWPSSLLLSFFPDAKFIELTVALNFRTTRIVLSYSSKFKYPRQVPVKTPKADVISKDLVRRGFRSVGPTVVYSFMQAAGITNDHLTSCFRFQECVTAAGAGEENVIEDTRPEERKTDSSTETELSMAIDGLSFSSE